MRQAPELILNSTTALSTEKAIEAIKLSEEQLDICRGVQNKATGNMLVIARAGTGKTFLILQCLAIVFGRIAVVAYNRKIAKEIKGKIAKAGHRHVDSGTFHSFGQRIMSAIYPNAKLEGRGARNAGYTKMTRILKELEVPQYLKAFVKKAVSMAMMQGFGVRTTDTRPVSTRNPNFAFASPKDLGAWRNMVAHYRIDSCLAENNLAMQLAGSREEVILEGLRFAYKAMVASLKMVHEVYSYDDMLYMPLYLNAPISTYDFVFVDESQDSNPLRVEWAARMMAPGGRIMFVGDDKQAIYGFTGAMSHALEDIRNRFNCNTFKMTVTFRCSQAVTRNAAKLVPDYRAAPGNREGSVSYIDEEQFSGMAALDLTDGATSDVDNIGGSLNLVPGEDAIICRNTRPLVAIAFDLIRRDIPCHIEGKEVGSDLVMQIKYIDEKLKSIVKFEKKMDQYLATEVAKLIKAESEMEAELLTDKIETLRVIMHGLPKGSTMDDVIAKIESLFGDNEDVPVKTVALMTAHKSKGLEFLRVFGWGVTLYMPSKMARLDHEMEQEFNLEYVLKTRAILHYVEVFVVPPPPKKDR
jgi:DNA helicase-2/ATP-dependent DNA helicase PcrA